MTAFSSPPRYHVATISRLMFCKQTKQKYTIIGIADTKNGKNSKKMEKNLKKDYEDAVSAYLKAFCEMYGLQYDEDCWVGRELGGIAEVGDYFFGFDDMKRCVDEGYGFR